MGKPPRGSAIECAVVVPPCAIAIPDKQLAQAIFIRLLYFPAHQQQLEAISDNAHCQWPKVSAAGEFFEIFMLASNACAKASIPVLAVNNVGR